MQELERLQLTNEMHLILVHAEMDHLRRGATSGCIPMDLVCSSIGKSAAPKRLQELQHLKERLHSGLPDGSILRAADSEVDESATGFQLLVVTVSIEQVCCCA